MFRRRKKSGSQIIQSDTIKSLSNTIKGYSHYETKNDRKSTDIALRTYLHVALIDLSDAFTKVQGQLMQAQILSAWQAGNMILREISDLREFLKRDVYRHSTFFDANDVSSIIEISVLYILESELILTLIDSQKLSEELYKDIINVDMMDVEKNVLKIKSYINTIGAGIRDRAELIASFELVGV